MNTSPCLLLPRAAADLWSRYHLALFIVAVLSVSTPASGQDPVPGR